MIIRGDPGPHLVGIDYDFDKVEGWSSEHIYEGLAAEMDAFAAANLGSDRIRSTQDGPIRRTRLITASSQIFNGESEEPEFDVWELLGNDIEEPLWNNPKVLKFDNALLAFMRNGLENNDPAVLADADAQLFYDHMLAGKTGYLTSQYVLRRTTTVSNRSTSKAVFTNVLKLHTTAQLKAAEAIPPEVLFDVDQIVANLPAIATGGPIASRFGYYWLKKTPGVSQRARRKFAKTYEYWLAAWSNWSYDLAT